MRRLHVQLTICARARSAAPAAAAPSHDRAGASDQLTTWTPLCVRPADRVEASLTEAGLWEEMAQRLDGPALALNPGQQQRLCITRTVATRPDVILMDEPCSALDPVATLRIEGLMRDLAGYYTILVVTHNMQQAARVSDWKGLFWLGELIEFGSTEQLSARPRQRLTEEYLTGRRG